MDFNNAVAVVTGGGSGIGAALCRALHKRGARVVVADFNEANAQLVSSELTGSTPARSASVDVRDSTAMAALVDDTIKSFGRIDFFINNAGILSVGEIRDLELGSWQRIIDTNLYGVINGTQAAYAVMLKQGSGHIVNVASLAGLICSPLYAPYAASKAAVIALSAALRIEAAPLGVRVSTVCPGNIDTAIFASSEVVNAKRSDVFKASALYPLDVNVAADTILKGVLRNQSVIVFPLYSKLLWILYRIAPFAIDYLQREVVRRFRAARIAE